MRILHVTTFLQGGAGLAIVSLALAQARLGHDVRVVADSGGERGYESYPEYVHALQRAGVPFFTVSSTFTRNAALNRRAAAALRRIAAGWRPAVVHAHAGTPAAVARLAGLDRGDRPARVVHTMHGWGIAKSPAQASEDLARLAQADVLVTPSQAALEGLRRLGLSRSDAEVIPYGLACEPEDAPLPRTDLARLAAAGSGPVALCVGTIGERKQQHLLVRALATPAARHVRAVLIGDGDPQPVAELARTLGVANRVVILGKRVQASRYLRLADVLVLPSQNEGLPLAVLEALRAGVPVVASALPEIAEALGPTLCDSLFTPGSVTALGEALRIACDVRDRSAVADRLRERFHARFRLERMVAAYQDAYRRAVDAAPLASGDLGLPEGGLPLQHVLPSDSERQQPPPDFRRVH